jgi:hypothetical protein
MMVAHRRAGKTVSAINDIISKALYNPREAPRYAYIAPLLKQGKQIAWEYLKKFAAPYDPKINESELWVELRAIPNSPRITIYGADNPDSFRGLYLDGAVLDEFGNMRLSIWREILLPALMDRRGWAVFMGTPNGPNHFRDMWYDAERDPESWARLFLPVSTTKQFSADELAEMKKIMDPEEYAQEMECSFEASVRGAVYARQMEAMQQEARIGDYPLQRGLPTSLIMDLGWRDDTTMGIYQERPGGIVCGYAFADRLRPIKDYIDHAVKWQERTGIKLTAVRLPHDAKAKSLQTGKAIIDNFIAEKRLPRPRLVPNLDLIDGIAATRQMFPSMYFHEKDTRGLVLALKSYHYEYDEDRKIYLTEPVHDWSSHYADMHRYASIVMSNGKPIPSIADKIDAIVKPVAQPVHYGFNLDQLWSTQEERSTRL